MKDGGRKILDIRVRNEAIKLMKIQRYLKLDKDRPTWAILADKLIGMKMARSQGKDDKVLRTPIIQNTKVDTRAGKDSLLPPL